MGKFRKTTLILLGPDFQVFVAIFFLFLVAIAFLIAFLWSEWLFWAFRKFWYFDQFFEGFSLSSTSSLTDLKNFENFKICDGTSLFCATKMMTKIWQKKAENLLNNLQTKQMSLFQKYKISKIEFSFPS